MNARIYDRPTCATIAVAVAVLAAACFVGFSPDAAGAAVPASTIAGSDVGAPIAWGACNPPGVDLQCARIQVPLDWDEPNGRAISLALIRHLASKPDERIGTLFINAGGPGESGVGLLLISDN